MAHVGCLGILLREALMAGRPSAGFGALVRARGMAARQERGSARLAVAGEDGGAQRWGRRAQT